MPMNPSVLENCGEVRMLMEDTDKMDVDIEKKRKGPELARTAKRHRSNACQNGNPEPLVVMTPEDKAKKEMLENVDGALKAAKSLHDRMNKELNEVAVVKRKLELKGWGPGPIEFLQTNTDKQTAAAESLFKEWCDLKSERDQASQGEKFDADRMQKKCLAMKTKEAETKTAYNNYRKNVLADFSKLR